MSILFLLIQECNKLFTKKMLPLSAQRIMKSFNTYFWTGPTPETFAKTQFALIVQFIIDDNQIYSWN